MALDGNAYTVATGVSEGTIPALYDEVAEKFIYEAEKLRPLGIDRSGMILGKPGKSFQVFKETEFEVGGLTEGVDTPVSALDFDSITLTVSWYGDAKQISKESLSYNFDFVWGDIREGASKALATNRDNQIMTELLNTTSSAIYPISSGVTRYTSGSMAATAVLTYEQLTKAWETMRISNRTLKAVIAYPSQLKSLMNDDKFIDTDYSSVGRINGSVGKLLVGDNPGGVDIMPHTAVQTTSENSVTTYNAIALGDRAFIYAQKVNPVFEFDEETKRSRSVTFHYYESFGVKNLHDASIIVLKSA
jgi:hypothetical protein